MERNIPWSTSYFQEISLVYDRAGQNAQTAKLMNELEQLALSEVYANCNLLNLPNKLTPQEAEALPMEDKERFIALLAEQGLLQFAPELQDQRIVTVLSPAFPLVMGCTLFSILNKIENLYDPMLFRLFPNMTLALLVPIGGKSGLLKWELFIQALYPSLKISEGSTNIAAVKAEPAPAKPEKKPESSPQKPVQKAEAPEKRGFFAKLFGKK